MQYSIENDILRLTVDSHGAEPVSVIHKPTGAELLWQADPAVWKRHAPILFPYTGKLTGGKMLAKGVEYAGGQHGFARDVEHTMTHHADNLLEFELHANAETLPKWPYAFVLRSTFTLEGETVHHTLTVENPVEDRAAASASATTRRSRCPFDDRHVAEDCRDPALTASSRRSASAPSPTACSTSESYHLARNVEAIPLTDDLFDNDSHAMVNLRSGACLCHREGHGPQRHLRCVGLPLHADLVCCQKAAALYLHRALAQSARRGKRSPRMGAAPLRRIPQARRKLPVHHPVHNVCAVKTGKDENTEKISLAPHRCAAGGAGLSGCCTACGCWTRPAALTGS